MSRRDKTNIAPALVVSVVVHVAAIAAVILFGALFQKPFKLGGGVPVTLVSQGPPEFMQAPQADENQEAQTEEPDPALPPEPLPPEPLPTPIPTPTLTPKPTPSKPQPTPTPNKKPTPRKELDLDRLLNDVQDSRPQKTPPKKTGGSKGPRRDPKAVQIGSGKRVSAATQGYLLNLGGDLSRRWNVNCLVEGGAVNATVKFRIANGGRLLGPPVAEKTTDQMGKIAAERAIRAIYAAEPFREFPPELYGEELIYPFDAAAACANR